jgi:hypothetical protein
MGAAGRSLAASVCSQLTVLVNARGQVRRPTLRHRRVRDRALVFGLARMCVDGLLGDVDGDTAARLAREVTDVLGRGLAHRDGDSP